MAIPCPRCGRQYDSTLFAFDRTVRCSCGAVVDRNASIGAPDPAENGDQIGSRNPSSTKRQTAPSETSRGE
ncbi:MAG: hypothetical protein JW958_13000 [Candidatus Eisenbacteria bacterium]|nr:hypothetical protein [Candidatus Eisenbacteria bacterium]